MKRSWSHGGYHKTDNPTGRALPRPQIIPGAPKRIPTGRSEFTCKCSGCEKLWDGGWCGEHKKFAYAVKATCTFREGTDEKEIGK